MPEKKRSEEWKRQVGQRLRAVRVAAGYKAARVFAQRIGVGESAYTNWERGERLVEPEDLRKFAELCPKVGDGDIRRRV